jgi:uncharacterized protein (TIGR03382 family)
MGDWTIKVADRLAQDTGDLQSWRIIFHGTNTRTDQGATLTNTTMPDATQYAAYTHAFTFNSVGTGVMWSVQGTLPVGLTLTQNGEITGQPLQDGPYNFTVSAQSAYPPCFASESVTLTVLSGDPPEPGTTSKRGGGGGSCSAAAGGSAVLWATGGAAWALLRRRRRP